MSFSFKALSPKKDYKDASQRFIYTDGSTYGTAGIKRFGTNPVVQFACVSTILIGAANAMLLPASQRQKFILGQIAFAVLGSAIFTHLHWKYSCKGNRVIDKTGQMHSNVATASQSLSYKIDATLCLTITPLAVVGMYPLIGVPWPLVTYRTAQCAWALYAKHKLDKAEWTVTDHPPTISRQEIEVKQASLIPVPSNN